MRGGKYSLFEAGTRVPFVTYWKGTIAPRVSDALVCQVDLMTSLASMVDSALEGPDSKNLIEALLGKSDTGRSHLIIEATTRTALRKGDWVLIPPYKGSPLNQQVNIETGNSKDFQLYNLKDDLDQETNLADSNPEKLTELLEVFKTERGAGYNETEAFELK